MSKQPLTGLMLAASLALSVLAGCQAPQMAGMPQGAQLAPAKQQAGTETSQTAALAMADEQEMEDYGYIADDAEAGSAYAVMAVGADPAASGEAAITADAGASAAAEPKRDAARARLSAEIRERLEARRAEIKAKIQARLDKRMIERGALQRALTRAPWVENADGTKTKTLEFSVTKTAGGKTMTKSSKMVRTVDADGVLVYSSTELSQATPSGMTRTATRTKTLQADGSYVVVFDATHAHADGRSRVAHWEKTIALAGEVTGTGSITFKNADGSTAKVVTLNFGGSEEENTAKAKDGTTGTTAEVTADVEGNVDAAVTDTDSGASAAVTVEAE